MWFFMTTVLPSFRLQGDLLALSNWFEDRELVWLESWFKVMSIPHFHAGDGSPTLSFFNLPSTEIDLRFIHSAKRVAKFVPALKDHTQSEASLESFKHYYKKYSEFQNIPFAPHSKHWEVAPDEETFKKWRLYWKKFTRIQIRRPGILQAFHRLHLRHFHHSFDGARYDPLKPNRSSTICSLCFAAPDSIDHLLFGCKWAHHLWKDIIHQDPTHSALTRKEVYAPHWRREEDEFIDINWFVHTILEVRRQRRSHPVLLSADSQNLVSQELSRVLNSKLREYEYTEL